MDGRGAVMNVLAGVILGGAVPIFGTIAFEQAYPDFTWFDHFLTIILLCILCAAIGVLVNLPWNQIQESPAQPHIEPFEQPEAEYIFDAGLDEEGTAERPQEESSSHRRRRHDATTSFAMSRREALRTLELDLHADETQVRDAFRRLAKEHHPDHATAHGVEAVAQATQKFQKVRAAYEVLQADGQNA